MDSIKYTNDGKKVKVIGKLNSEEKIVQEIYVSEDGSEIPSGEQFTTKSLHDEPVKSWKEKKLEKVEANYEKKRQEYKDKQKRLRKEHRKIKSRLKSKTSYLKKLENMLPENEYDQLEMFLFDEIKYLVDLGYGSKIYEWENFSQLDHLDRSDIKLLSLFGRDDGSMRWKINSYTDGSSWHKRNIVPCRSKEEAVEVLKQYIYEKLEDSEKVRSSHIELAEEYGFELPEKKVKKYYESKLESKKERLDENLKNRKAIEEEVSNIKEEIETNKG